MKKSWKTILIVGVVLIAAGAALFGLSLTLGSRLTQLWDGTLHYPSWISVGESSVTVGDDDAWAEQYRSDGVYAVDAAGLDALDVCWLSGAVRIELTNGTQVVFTENSVAMEDALRWTVTDGTLAIDFCRPGARELPKKTLTVSIPASLAADMSVFSCDCTSASLTVNGALNADSFRFSSTSGELQAAAVTAGTVSLGSTSGALTFSGAYETLNASSTSGAVMVEGGAAAQRTTVETTSGRVSLQGMGGDIAVYTNSGEVSVKGDLCPTALDIETTSGAVGLSLPADAAFTLLYDTTSGTFSCGLATVMQGERILCNGGGAAFSVSTTSGGLTIGEN